jgi:hypothetical protein
MRLLGNYQSNLTAYLYQQLLAQLEAGISSGEYGAGTLFDTAAAQTIQAEGQNFSSLTVPSAGNTAYVSDVNTPLDTLQARYNAITSEIANMQSTVNSLLAMVEKESNLLDKTIAAAEIEVWGSQQPFLPTGQLSLWSFESGHGITSTTYPTTGGATYQTDPINDVVYTAAVPDVSYVLSGQATATQGIGSPTTHREIPIKEIAWSFTPNSSLTQFEMIYGDDQTWAYLSTLEPSPILTFGAPVITVQLPIGGSAHGIYTVTGSVVGGSLPVYVRILFYPRQVNMTANNLTSGETIQLSTYNITANTVQVFTTTKVFVQGIDYTISSSGSILTVVPTGALPGNNITILFEEYYPAYQCSIDQTHWSPIFMLDQYRPYPDDTTDFIPIDIQNGNFPLFDELAVPLGLYLQIVGSNPDIAAAGEMLLLVTTPGSGTFGETAQLTITLQQAVYMSGLRLDPFTNFPPTVTNITAYGFTDNVQTVVVNTPFILDREVTFKFARQLVRKFVVTFAQQNYSLKEYLVQQPDALRRNTLAQLQSSLPFSVQRPQPGIPQHFEGSLYEFGVQHIAAFDDLPNLPGVFTSGPYLVIGTPELIRLDTAVTNMSTNAVYLGYIAYNANDAILEQGEGAFTPGTTIVYPGSLTADHVDFFVKYVFRNELSVAQALQLQVTTR